MFEEKVGQGAFVRPGLSCLICTMASTPSSQDKAIISKARYAPPWVDLSIIGIAGGSGSGKSSIARSIVNQLNLPWVVILSMVGEARSRHLYDVLLISPWQDSYYKSLDPESSRKAFLNEFDFDAPSVGYGVFVFRADIHVADRIEGPRL